MSSASLFTFSYTHQRASPLCSACSQVYQGSMSLSPAHTCLFLLLWHTWLWKWQITFPKFPRQLGRLPPSSRPKGGREEKRPHFLAPPLPLKLPHYSLLLLKCLWSSPSPVPQAGWPTLQVLVSRQAILAWPLRSWHPVHSWVLIERLPP